MKKIPLTKGQCALVDDEDYEYLNQWKWSASWNPNIKSFYATRNMRFEGKRKTLFMHRLVMSTPKGMHTDHVNHDTLDNRKSNMRICTPTQNLKNRRKRIDNKSGFIGVSLHKIIHKNRTYQYFVAQIGFCNKTIYLGSFKTAELASQAYQTKAKELFGEYKLT